MFKFILFVNILVLCKEATTKGPCVRFLNGCCPSTYWDSANKTCVACPPGYFGINCNKSCPYPYFGAICGQSCHCEMQFCNSASGCTKGNDSNTTEAVAKSNPFEGDEENITKCIDIKEPPSTNKRTSIITALIFVTSVLAVITLAYMIILCIDKHSKKDVIV